MQIRKNKLKLSYLKQLPQVIESYVVESGCTLDTSKVVSSTINNITYGVEHKGHDSWFIGDLDGYCLCRVDRDADGELVYTAYQLWIHPSQRTGKLVHSLIQFLRFYAQKQGYARLYIISSRLDCIKAYSRGLGKQFKATAVTFSEEF